MWHKNKFIVSFRRKTQHKSDSKEYLIHKDARTMTQENNTNSDFLATSTEIEISIHCVNSTHKAIDKCCFIIEVKTS